ncbi:hypothetical protein [Halobacterium zhouii]|uniref:hypothetical protein n=1 Tax=Halobacterium zhouii TaxID=2902624 RepID=UPI001E654E05|nr:hypothetical protein [Halobacterium zhouii]
MAATCQSVRITADLTMHVTRNATGNLDDGAERTVASVDCVTDVVSVDVTDLRPRLNDLEIEASVEVAANLEDAPDVETAGRDALVSAFGVQRVESLDVERTPAAAGDPVQEYG